VLEEVYGVPVERSVWHRLSIHSYCKL